MTDNAKQDAQQNTQDAVISNAKLISDFEYTAPKKVLFVIATAISQMFVFGTLFSFGLLLPVLVPAFKSTVGDLSTAGSLYFGMFFVGGIFSGIFLAKLGPRWVAFCGSLLWGGGIIGSSFVGSLPGFVGLFGVVGGIGGGMLYFATLTTLPLVLGEKFRTAGLTVSTAGGSLGQILWSFVISNDISLTQWRATLATFAYVGLALLLVLSLLFMPSTLPVLVNQAGSAKTLLKDRTYLLALLSLGLTQFAVFIPFAHLVRFAVERGIVYNEAARLLGFAAVASFCGRLVCGLGALKTGSVWMMRLVYFELTIVCFCWHLCTTYDSMIVFAVLYGFGAGGQLSLQPIMFSDLWGSAMFRMTMTFGIFVMIPGSMAGGTVAGNMHDVYGNYNEATFFTAALWLGAFLCLLLMRSTPFKESVNLTSASDEQPSSSNTKQTIDQVAESKV